MHSDTAYCVILLQGEQSTCCVGLFCKVHIWYHDPGAQVCAWYKHDPMDWYTTPVPLTLAIIYL